MTPEDIAREHVHCNVTGLVSELIELDSDLGRDIMYGHEDDEQRAYDAFEVWIVSHWLARRLKTHNHRVIELGYQHYWARGAAGQAISMDPVIEAIAKEA